MSDGNGLDEFLNGGGSPASEAQPGAEAPAAVVEEAAPGAPAPEAEAPGGPARDGLGRFAPKGDEAAPAVAAAVDGAPPAPKRELTPDEHPALKAERLRRQEAERERDELRALAAPPAPPARQPEPELPASPPDRFEDPDGYDRWLTQTVTQRARAEAVAAMQEERIALSAERARGKYEDFPEKASVFARLAAANPALEHTLRHHPDPAEYAYSTAKLHLELQQHGGSIEALIAAREEAARAAARAEVEGVRPPASAASAEVIIPDSLASSQSARSSADAPLGPPSLEQILNRPWK